MYRSTVRRFAATAWVASGLSWAGIAAAQSEQDLSFTTGLWTRSNLLGDAGSVRSGLGNLGITIGIQDINEVWGNVSGGVQRGAAYDGVTLLSVASTPSAPLAGRAARSMSVPGTFEAAT